MTFEEYIVIHQFKKSFPDFPKGEILKSESPDFIIREGPKKKIGIELVQLLPAPEHHYTQAGILKPKYSYEQILMTLRLKESKRRSYSNPRLQALWLLIHFDYLDSSGQFNLNNHIDKWHFPHGFDRVLLFDLFENRWYPLQRLS